MKIIEKKNNIVEDIFNGKINIDEINSLIENNKIIKLKDALDITEEEKEQIFKEFEIIKNLYENNKV